MSLHPTTDKMWEDYVRQVAAVYGIPEWVARDRIMAAFVALAQGQETRGDE